MPLFEFGDVRILLLIVLSPKNVNSPSVKILQTVAILLERLIVAPTEKKAESDSEFGYNPAAAPPAKCDQFAPLAHSDDAPPIQYQ